MRRQLLKLLLPTEQARTMVFQTAEALRRSDAGEPGAYPLARILTPLIKFRACRDARKVTGDAMEVRGGCGYIEEWATRAWCATPTWARSGKAPATSWRWT
jgi:acyl-CoA dehydrogenase